MSEQSGGSNGAPAENATGDGGDGNSNNNGNSGDNSRTRRRRGGRNGRQRTARNNRFEGKCEDLKKHVYDVAPVQNSYDLFGTTTKAIGKHVATKYEDAADFRTGLVELRLPVLVQPANPPLDDPIALELWKIDIREFRDKQRKRAAVQGKAFGLILGQCSRAIRDKIEAAPTWSAANDTNDIMALLRLIRQAMCTGSTTRFPVHALVDATINL
mmetsp:Transcript_24339/g.36098  ORF Transcript_24339/g.36098 Transcript_24339/m.36098 type:complete len:214 (+) Transcript_24339:1120-1761(+)